MITLLNDAGAAWATWFAPVIVQNTIFLVIVLAVLHFLRNAPAKTRAAIAAVGLAKLAIPPFLTWTQPAAESATETGAAITTLLFPFTGTTPSPGTFTTWTGGLFLPAVLMTIWASMAIARLGWVILQTYQLKWSVRHAKQLPADPTTRRAQRRGVTIWQSAGIGLPLTLGPLPKRIYVPADWDTWPLSHRQAALDHELAHITRRDGLVKLLEIVVQAVYFFHPLVHVLVRNLRSWREMACDDAAVAPHPAARLDYSKFLAELAGRAPVPLPATESASTLFRGEGELLSRVSHQIREGKMKNVSKKKLTGVVALLIMAALPLSMVLAESPTAPTPPAAVSPVDELASGSDPGGEVLVKPDAPAPPDAPPPPPKYNVMVEIRSNTIVVDGVKTTQKEFATVMASAAKKQKKTPVVILDTDGSTSMGQLHAVQADLKKLGLTKVMYSGEMGKKVGMALPSKDSRKKIQTLPDDKLLRVAVLEDGILTINGKKTAGAQLVKIVQKELQREEFLVVVLETEQETSYGAFVQVLDDLKKAGATRIAIEDPSM
jgi:beta-lactamase regulating signal transducer with metallopeptidase domain/biopolymer transport protein ExbD